MLAYPSFALLKENLPDVRLYALVSPYAKPMAEVCPWIDQILIDPASTGKWPSAFPLANLFREERFDAIITLYSTTRVGLAAALAKIPNRLAPSTKFAQVFYNERLAQRRSRSEKPEYLYNQDLVRYFLEIQDIPIKNEPAPPYLRFDEHRVYQLRSTFCQSHGIEPECRLIFIHPGSGGSARNLSIDQFALLASKLNSKNGHHIVVSAGPDELEQTEAVCALLDDTPHSVYHSTKGLRTFAEQIRFADLFVSGSTGPLHIAGAMDIPTAAFYPRRRSSTALRWQTLNSPAHRLSFSPEADEESEDMQSIDVIKAARVISERFLMKSAEPNQNSPSMH